MTNYILKLHLDFETCLGRRKTYSCRSETLKILEFHLLLAKTGTREKLVLSLLGGYGTIRIGRSSKT